MSLTYTPAGNLGSPRPSFQLQAVDGKTYSDADFMASSVLVVLFICNHCPYVQALEDRILALAKKFLPHGVQFLAICSNDATEYPEDSFENLRQRWISKQYPFVYLHDPQQKVARAFGAVCTPDFFVYHQKSPPATNPPGPFTLVYRGRFDDSWKNASQVRHQELAAAIEAALQQRPPLKTQHPSMGCSIKFSPVGPGPHQPVKTPP